MKCFFPLSLRSGVSDLTAVLHRETFWSHGWSLLLPSPATVFLLLFFLIPLLLFLKLPSPRPLCLPALGLLLKPTKRSNTVAGKGWSGSACQHQSEDRRHKRTGEGKRYKARETEDNKWRELQRSCERSNIQDATLKKKKQVLFEHHELVRGP